MHEICQKAARQINALKRLSKFLNLDSRMAIYRTFITSNFGYCGLVWHACSAKHTHKLEKLQLRALRFVYHDYSSTYDELLERARRPSLHLGRLRTLATEVYKSVPKLNPPYVQDLYKRKTTNHHRRGHDTLHIPRVNSTTYGLHSSAYLGAKVGNCLPQTIKGAVTLSTFKTLIQSWYGETCKCANVHTAECTNLDEIKEPLYIIIYFVYNLFLYVQSKPLYALEVNFFRLHRLYLYVFLCVVSRSPE